MYVCVCNKKFLSFDLFFNIYKTKYVYKNPHSTIASNIDHKSISIKSINVFKGRAYLLFIILSNKILFVHAVPINKMTFATDAFMIFFSYLQDTPFNIINLY